MFGFSSITGDESIVFVDNVSFDGTDRGGKITTDGELLIGSTIAPHIRHAVPTGSNGVAITVGSGTLEIAQDGSFIQQHVYYVGKHGADTNNGMNINTAVKTFGQALLLATAETPTAVNKFSIVCFDDGIYTENIVCVPYVDINAPEANIVGTLTLADDSHIKFGTQSVATGTIGILKTAGSRYSFVEIDNIDIAGTGVGIICLAGYVNVTWKTMTVANGFGVGDLSSGILHMHIKGGDIYVTGTGTAIARANAGFTVGHVDHIIDNGGGNGVGINCFLGELNLSIDSIQGFSIGIDANGGVSNINCDSLSSTVAFDVANGATLNLITNTLTGTETIGATGILNKIDLDGACQIRGNATFLNNAAATTRSLIVKNTDTDPGSYSAISVSSAPAGGDAFIFYEVSGATQYYSSGIDNSDSDNFKITNSTSPSAGTELFKMTPTGVITLNNDLDVTEGGTGVSTLTSHGILMGNGAGDIQATAEPTDGQILIGDTGGFPILGTITAGDGITVTNAAGSITVAATGAFKWTEITAASADLAVQNGYIANRATQVILTLPATAALGDMIRVTGKGEGGWKIAQRANQYINNVDVTSTVGVGGSLSSTQQFDSVELVCTTTDVGFNVVPVTGNWTIV
jgi:hypothetical protein